MSSITPHSFPHSFSFSVINKEELENANHFLQSGETFFKEGKLADALEQFQKCLMIRERLEPNSLNLARCCNQIGFVSHAQGKFNEALEQFQKSSLICKQLAPDGLDMAESYDGLGMVFHAQRKLDEALEQFQKSFMIREHLKSDSLAVAKSYNNFGIIYGEQNKFDEALEQFQKSIAIIERLSPNSQDLAQLYQNMGMIFKLQDKLAEALKAFDKALTFDPTDARSTRNRLEVIAEIAKRNEELQESTAAAIEAQQQQIDGQKEQEPVLTSRADMPPSVVGSSNVELEAESTEYLEQQNTETLGPVTSQLAQSVVQSNEQQQTDEQKEQTSQSKDALQETNVKEASTKSCCAIQ